jgi:hypothetical protein
MSAATIPQSKKSTQGNVQRMTKLSPYIDLLTQMRQSSKTSEESRRIDVLTVLIAKLPSNEVKESELVVDFCHSKALSVSHFI